MTELVVLWSQCTVPERHHGASHQGPTSTNQDLDALHHEQVEEDDPRLPVALRHEACKRRRKRNSSPFCGEVFGCTDHTKVTTLPCFCLHYLCARQCTSKSTRGVPWPITQSCPISFPGSQPTHRSCIATVPHKIRQFF